MGHMNYSIELKRALVKRFLSEPENQIGHFSRENGVPESCLRDWIRQSELGILGVMKRTKYVQNWTFSDKFLAILEYEKLSEEEQGKWLRLRGLKSEKIETWKQELSSMLNQLENQGKNAFENKKIKNLEKELSLKDKALAEVSALLFAKKKLEAIFGENSEDK